MGGWTAGTILQVPGAHTNERLSERRANDVRLGEPHRHHQGHAPDHLLLGPQRAPRRQRAVAGGDQIVDRRRMLTPHSRAISIHYCADRRRIGAPINTRTWRAPRSPPRRRQRVEPPHRAPRRTSPVPRRNRQGTMSGAFLRRRDRTVRPLRVMHYPSAVNRRMRSLDRR